MAAIENGQAKVEENRFRRMAARRGWRLTKSRDRDPRSLTFGCYALIVNRTNALVPVTDPIGRGFPFDNLQQVEEFLIDDEIERNLLQALARGQRFGISDLAMSLGVRATQVRAGLDNLRLQGMVEQGMKDRWTITLAGKDAIAG